MRTSIRAVIACLLLVGLWGCGSSSSSTTPTRHLHTSWAEASDTVQGMAAASDGVARIRVKAVADTGVDKDAGGGTPYTLFTVTVDRWMKGTGGDQITIKQTGDKTLEVEGDPLLQVGETAVVFLHEFAAGQYYIVGGPTGRLHIDSLDNLVPLPAGVLKDHGPVSGLAAAVK